MTDPEGGVTVRQERRGDGGAVAFVTIDNPRRLNALSTHIIEALVATFDDLRDDDRLRAAVLTGAGEKAFAGGANIYELNELTPASGRRYIRRMHQACLAVRELPVPVIARINGYCLGAGMELVAACDLRVAAEHAVFGMPEVKIGLPSVIEAALLPDLVGWGKARVILLTGENFSATEAQRIGLVEKAVPAEALDAAVTAWLDSILAAGPRAVRSQKRLMREWEQLSREDAVAAGIEAFAEACATDEPQRLMAPFFARKRSPQS